MGSRAAYTRVRAWRGRQAAAQQLAWLPHCAVHAHWLVRFPCSAQRVRKENDQLRSEVTRLRALHAQGSDGSGDAPLAAGVAPGSLEAAGSVGAAVQLQLQAPSSGSLSDLLAPTLPVTAGVGGTGDAFHPNTAGRAAAMPADPPCPGSTRPGPCFAPAATADTGASGTVLLCVPPKQLHAALNLYYRELQAFAASAQLERVPADGERQPGAFAACAVV